MQHMLRHAGPVPEATGTGAQTHRHAGTLGVTAKINALRHLFSVQVKVLCLLVGFFSGRGSEVATPEDHCKVVRVLQPASKRGLFWRGCLRQACVTFADDVQASCAPAATDRPFEVRPPGDARRDIRRAVAAVFAGGAIDLRVLHSTARAAASPPP